MTGKIKKKIDNYVELKTTETKNIYGVIYKEKSYVVNCYFSDDNCGDYEWEVFDEKGNYIKDENLKDEITNFVNDMESE